MKYRQNNFTKFSLWVFGLVFIIMATLLCTTSCEHERHNPPYDLNTDTTAVSVDTLTQSFSSVDEFMAYRNELISVKTADSVIYNMPEYVVYNVCNVLLKRQGSFTKMEVALEYLNNYSVYDNLANKVDKPDDPLQVVEKDTTIDGKIHKIVTKIY